MLLLPHGLEGQGPDHSSGRIERFLQLCAEGSMTVALPSEPANYFHLLRRHALDGVSPAAGRVHAEVDAAQPRRGQPGGRLHRGAGSARSSTTRATARPTAPPSDVHDLVLCSGKIFWELAAARDKRQERSTPHDTAIVRVEQLYPLPHRQIAAVLERYPNADNVRWVQEEPANQGAWPYFGLELPEKLPERLSRITRVSRRRMAAPAPGSSKVHEVEQTDDHRPGVPVTGPGG